MWGGPLYLAMLVLLLFFILPKNKLSIAGNMVDFYWLFVNQKTKNCDFRRFWAILGVFWQFLTQFSKMTEYNQFTFSGTLVRLNIFCLGLFRAFSDAWFAQNKVLTELNSTISVVHFSFARIFEYFKVVRFCSYSKFKVSHGCSLQWWKPFVDIFFHLREIRKRTLGNIKKTGLILSSESVNMLKRGVVAAVHVVKIHSKSTPIFFVFISICFYSAFTFLRFLSSSWTVKSQF